MASALAFGSASYDEVVVCGFLLAPALEAKQVRPPRQPPSTSTISTTLCLQSARKRMISWSARPSVTPWGWRLKRSAT